MEILITSLVDLKKSQHNRPHQFVKYLSQNHNVTVLSVNDWWKGNQGDLESYSADFQNILENIDYHYLTERKIPPFVQEVLFTKKINELSKENFDVHLNYNTLVMGYRASKNFKTVFDVADDIPAMIRSTPQIPNILSPVGGYMADYYLQKIIKTADHFTFTNIELKEKYRINENKSTIIPNGVDIENFKNIKNAKEKLGLDGFIIGYVGVLREWVNFEPIFKALTYLKDDIKFLIVGSEGRLIENKLLAKKYGLDNRVIFTGMIKYSKIPLYISAMNICLIPFRINEISENALPLKLFEYMACEKPVISTPISPIKNILNENVLYATNENEYKEMINLIYKDDKLRKKLGKKGRTISEEYSWEKISLKLDNLLKTVAYGENIENIPTESTISEKLC